MSNKTSTQTDKAAVKTTIETKTNKFRNSALEGISANWLDILTSNKPTESTDTEESMNVMLCNILQQLDPKKITPPVGKIFEFARLTDLNKIKVVIIGQDPYPRAGDAHGLAFSCLTGVPATLKNIYRCLLASKLITDIPDSGNLEYWAKQGVLLINTALTTEIGRSDEHVNIWTDYIIGLLQILSARKPLIFMLWGKIARDLSQYLDSKSIIMEWTHPSPQMQAKYPFIKCPHFKDANKYLIKLGTEPIDWNVEPEKTDVEIAFGSGPKTQVIFTDGSCYPNKICPESVAGYAASFTLGSMTDTVLYGCIENRPHFASNQRAEGIAMLKAMEHLQTNLHEWDDAVIVSDSEFWIKMFENYMPKWAIEDSFETKKNPDLTKKMWDVYTTLTEEYTKTIRFRHVKSHNKDGWGSAEEGTYENFCFVNNQYVDELASYARVNLTPGEHVVTVAKYDGESADSDKPTDKTESVEEANADEAE